MAAAPIFWLSLSLSSYGLGSAQEPARPKGALVLIWNGKDDPKNAPLEKGIQEGLGSAPDGSYEYYPEYLEDNRFPEEKQSLAMRDYLRQKYGDDRIGVILAPTAPSLNFLLKYRSELFPKTPIVFHTSDRAKADNKADANSVAVLVDNPYRNTIDMALKLQPDTGEILIIAGEKDHSMKTDMQVRNWLKEFEDKGVKLTSLSDLNLDQLITKVKSAPEHSIILYVKYSQEELKTLDLPNSLTLIAGAARVPVYTVGDSLLGRGSVGGHTVSIEDCGRVIGETALRVINGARPQDMPVVPVPTRPIIDWRQFRRWEINKNLAPAGTVFYYKEPTFWEEYKWWIIGSISFSVIQTLLIVALSLQRARRKKIEAALGDKELRLREAQTIAHMGSFHWDVSDDSIVWSDELYRIYGLEPGKSHITYKTYIESVHPDHREHVGRSLEQALTSRVSFEHEYRIVRSDGETRWISTHGRPIFDADWTLIAMQGVCQDITDRKRAEEALRESEERARRTLVEQMLAGVVECDAGGKFVMVNQRYCDITGYTEAELRGMVITDITHPDDLPNCIKLFGRLLETGESFVSEKRYIRRDGSDVWVNNNVSPVYDADGKIEKAVAVVTDITDRKRAEREREQLLKQEKAARAEAQAANQSKDEFLTVVSHELRSPLNSILGYARLLRTRPSDVSQIKQTVEIIERNGRMQLQLIEDLLDTARIISGKLKLEVSPVALVSIVTAAIEAVRPAAQAKSIEMVSHIDPRAGQIAGDPGRLQQVRSNSRPSQGASNCVWRAWTVTYASRSATPVRALNRSSCLSSSTASANRTHRPRGASEAWV
jgi:PAS domain S-box-containing protein